MHGPICLVRLALAALAALAAVCSLSITCPLRVAAQARPSEADMFGAPAPTESEAPTPPSAAPAEPAPPIPGAPEEPAKPPEPAQGAAAQPSSSADARDQAVLGGVDRPMFTEEAAPADPLTIGGQIYLRAQTVVLEDKSPKDYTLTSPTLLDAYFDARPNDRVRGFVLGRMSYDPLQPASQSAFASTSMMTTGGTSGSASVSPIYGGATNAPRVLLDQLWLRFDIAHTVFVTAGRQHVRWGTARFWTPADFLHLRRRNPLDVFDARTGTTMIKVHLPIESRAWNFYAYGVTDGADGRPTLSTPAGALRAEFVFDALEFGLGVFGRPKSRAKFAADLSMGIGDFDIYGELAVVDARDSDRVRFADELLPGLAGGAPGLFMCDPSQAGAALGGQALLQAVDTLYPVYRNMGYRPQAVIGLNYSRRYNDNDTFTLGAEYFYNGLGYDDPNAYLGVLVPHSTALRNPASPFYLGQHYAGLFITFPAPFKLDLHTFTLSTLGNLSDRTFTSRLDYAYVLLTHLRLEAYAAVLYGKRGGEFRYTPPSAIVQAAEAANCDVASLGLSSQPSVFMLGLGLRLAI